MKPLRSTVAVALLSAGAVAAGFFGGGNLLQRVEFARAEAQVEVNREQISKAEDLSTVFRHVGKVLEPSVVNINVKKTIKLGRGMDPNLLRKFFQDHGGGDAMPDLPDPGAAPDATTPDGGGEDMQEIGTGSGVIMESSDGYGYILTNNHVAGGASEMEITLSDGRMIKNGKLLGADAKSDLAVVKIKADRLIPATWGNSDQLDKGDWVMAFGSPFGYVGSMTHGIVSALNRHDVGILGQQGYENFIQVDAPINPGNSGGPLVNIHGEVIGINTAIATRSGGFQGIGFAVPSNQAKLVYSQIKNKGHVTRGWLGVSISDVARNLPMARSQFGFKGDTGVLVEETFPNTPATDKLQAGDIISAYNTQPVENVQQLRNAVAATMPNTDVKLTVWREGKAQEVTLKIGEQPENLELARGTTGRATGGRLAPGTAEALGMKLENVTPDLIKKLGLEDGATGAVVTNVDRNSVAFKAGLQPGDLITRVGTQTVASAKEASSALAKADVNKGITLYVTSRGGSRFAFVQNEPKAGTDTQPDDAK